MTEAGSVPQGKHRSAERDSSSSKTKHCQGKKHLSALWFWDHKRFTMSQNPPRCLFSCLELEERRRKRDIVVARLCSRLPGLCDVTRWYLCMSKPFVYMLWGMQALTGGRAVISWRRSCESHSAYQMLEGLYEHITAAAVLSGTVWRQRLDCVMTWLRSVIFTQILTWKAAVWGFDCEIKQLHWLYENTYSWSTYHIKTNSKEGSQSRPAF